jgi:hypothetical protein
MPRPAAALLACTLALAACSSDAPGAPGASEDEGSAASVVEISATEPLLVSGAESEQVATAASEQLWDTAPLVVLAPADDEALQARAAGVAVGLGAPLLLTSTPLAGSAGGEDDPVARELGRLGAEAVLAFGGAADWAREHGNGVDVVPAPDDPEALHELTGLELAEAPTGDADVLRTVAGLTPGEAVPLLGDPAGPSPTASAGVEPEEEPGELPDTEPPAPETDAVVLASTEGPDTLAAVATARAAGAPVIVVDSPDPRASSEAVQALAGEPDRAVVALGDAFGPADRLAHVVAVAETGVELPGGGQLAAPGRHLIALYGHPGAPALGVLGEQGIEASVARARELAESYDPSAEAPVVPTFEIITTIASSAAGADGDYSDEADVEDIRPWVEAAGEAGVYVVLDLQPGRTDFLSQAKRYEELLAYPHVGLALDPEWRLKPDQRHLRQIGTVTAAEINQVGEWLSGVVRERDLPQKLLLLHQFRHSMISDRDTLDLTHPELATLVQMDGHGTRGMKRDTWNALTETAPPELLFGWKNFYDEDTPTWTPAETLELTPTPWFVSYQ